MDEEAPRTSPEIEALRRRISPAAFARREEEARRKAAVIELVKKACPKAKRPSRETLRRVVPGEDRTNVLRWWRLAESRSGELWERLFRRQQPAELWEVPEAWSNAILTLGLQEPAPTWQQIQALLVRQFGPEARLCESTIRKVLRSGGISPGNRATGPAEQVVEVTGGGLLVLLLAASLETRAVTKLAQAAMWATDAAAEEAVELGREPEPEGRDALGRLTAEYNRNVVERLQLRGATVFQSVDEAVIGRDLTQLRVVHLHERSMTRHLASLIALPLVTERRGTAGLRDPGGAWLTVFAGRDYQPATLEKTLNGLKYLKVGAALWECHARIWHEVTSRWLEGEPLWRQLVAYIDGSKDPWWTDRFARSGKVERTGRVQPCLERTALTTGAGVPLLVEVVSGNDDLSESAVRMLARCDEAVGSYLVGRLTVVDAACCELGMVRRFLADEGRDMITVLKGGLARGKKVEPLGEWQPYRQRDQVREASVELASKPESLRVRAVELVRRDSRHPHPTIFITTASVDDLPTVEVADAYLSRWPNIEDRFRVGRAGLGWNRTDGFGASQVTHYALLRKRWEVSRKLEKAVEAVAEATDSEAEARATLQLAAAEDKAARRQAEAAQPAEPSDGPRATLQLAAAEAKAAQRQPDAAQPAEPSAGRVRKAKRRLVERRQAVRTAKKAQDALAAEQQRLDSTPTEIYVRDTCLDTITSCFKMVLLCLLELICREYLGGRSMEPRSLCAAWMTLPVTIRTSASRALYEVTPNLRDSEMTALLRAALAEITRRRLHDEDGRLLVARLRGEGQEEREDDGRPGAIPDE